MFTHIYIFLIAPLLLLLLLICIIYKTSLLLCWPIIHFKYSLTVFISYIVLKYNTSFQCNTQWTPFNAPYTNKKTLSLYVISNPTPLTKDNTLFPTDIVTFCQFETDFMREILLSLGFLVSYTLYNLTRILLIKYFYALNPLRYDFIKMITLCFFNIIFYDVILGYTIMDKNYYIDLTFKVPFASLISDHCTMCRFPFWIKAYLKRVLTTSIISQIGSFYKEYSHLKPNSLTHPDFSLAKSL